MSWFPKRPGRYALGVDGRLYPLLTRRPIDVVAVVAITCRQPPAAPEPTPTSLASAPPRRAGGRINLNTVPSGMEQLAASWRKPDA